MATLMDKLNRLCKLTCEDTSALISETLDHSLPLSKRLRLKIHLAMCRVCRYYQKQLKIINSLGRAVGDETSELHQSVTLSDECKEKIKETLKNSQ